MIQQLFPGRTRHQIKLKFKEETQHALRLSEALSSRTKGETSLHCFLLFWFLGPSEVIVDTCQAMGHVLFYFVKLVFLISLIWLDTGIIFPDNVVLSIRHDELCKPIISPAPSTHSRRWEHKCTSVRQLWLILGFVLQQLTIFKLFAINVAFKWCCDLSFSCRSFILWKSDWAAATSCCSGRGRV